MFRVYPQEGSRLFFRVVLYATGEEMLTAVEGEQFAPAPPDAKDSLPAATTREWLVWSVSGTGRHRRHPCVAEIRLRTDRLGTAVIGHEAFHAAMAWGRRTDFDFSRLWEGAINADEEKLAYIHSNLCRAIVDKLYAIGAYK